MCLELFILSTKSQVLDSLLQQLPDEYRSIIENADVFRFQLIYTRISYDASGHVFFQDYTFHYSDTLYNYPASMVKLPVSIVALKKTEVLHNRGLDWDNPLCMDSLFCQKVLTNDSIGFPKYPHLKKWIKRMLVISDNKAYTSTYDFINCRTLHAWLDSWGFQKARIQHKFISKCISDSTYYTPTVYVLDKNSTDTLFVEYQDSACKFAPSDKNYEIGYILKKIKRRRKTIHQKVPKSFAHHNDWPLAYSHQLLKYLIFDKEWNVLSLASQYRDSLIRYLGAYPREYPDLEVDTTIYYDTWKKFFIYGGRYKYVKEDTLRSINIIGRAYGFLSETAYIIDFKNKIDFLMSASVYVNPNNIMDGEYQYKKAYDLFYQISRLIYHYEKQRNKPTAPFTYYEKLFRFR